ncbi:MAG: mechanosensitive ion channel family protein [Proteobacteria bacterium]|nr:mechanosensitive ion channel family protein [Pseudomonadota bacterium]
MNILDKTYYSNTIQEWLLALGIIVVAMVAGKALYWFFTTVARRLTAKTESKLDDIIIDMVEEPVVAAFILFGIWFGLRTLSLPEAAKTVTGGVLQFLVILMVGWMVVRLLDAFFREFLAPLSKKTESDLDDQLLPIARKGSKLIIWSVTVIVGLNNAGYDVGALIAGLGIGGLALAMAAKDTVSNVFGGFTIFTDRPFNLHDRVKVAGYDGVIKEIGVRSTRLQTLEGRTVTIPNAKFADSAVENISWEPSRKVVASLGLTYDTTPEKMEEAMRILREIVAKTPGLEEQMVVSFSEFGASSLNITFIYYIKKGEDIPAVQTTINLAVMRAFRDSGLDFAFPTQTVYTISSAA